MLKDNTKAKAELRNLFCAMAHHQWYPGSNHKAEILTRADYNPMTIIPPSEVLCIDLEFRNTAEHVKEVRTAGFQRER